MRNSSPKKPFRLSEQALQERIGRFVGEKNGRYKDIQKEDFYYDIIHNLSMDELSKKYNISKPTICKKCKEYFNKTLRELRKEK